MRIEKARCGNRDDTIRTGFLLLVPFRDAGSKIQALSESPFHDHSFLEYAPIEVEGRDRASPRSRSLKLNGTLYCTLPPPIVASKNETPIAAREYLRVSRWFCLVLAPSCKGLQAAECCPMYGVPVTCSNSLTIGEF